LKIELPENSVVSFYDQLDETVKRIIKNKVGNDNKEKVITFSIFECVQNSKKITYPDLASNKPIVTGKVIFFIDYWRVAPKPVYSPVYFNPTWEDIINACNDLLQKGDRCGVFLENLYQKEIKKGIKYIEFSIGS
jgi:hypothetical protein